jgi:hypothetical protein
MTSVFGKNFLLLGVLVFSACTGSKRDNGFSVTLKSRQGEPLTQVGNVTFTVEELREDFLERQGSFKGAPNLNTDKTRSEYIENQVTQEAMFQEAVALGYLDKADVRRDFKKVVVQKFMRDKLEESQTNFVATDEMMRDHYTKNQNLYNRDESIKVAYISVPFGANKENAKKAAALLQKSAMATVKNGNSAAFSRVPMDNADAVGKLGVSSVETNETDYLTKLEFEKKFGAGSFDSVKNSSEVGQVGVVAAVNNVYILTMKTGYRKALNETLEQAKDKITKRLSYENRGEFYKKMVEELKKKYNIKVFEDKVAELSKGAAEANVAVQDKKGPNEAQAKPGLPQAVEKKAEEHN